MNFLIVYERMNGYIMHIIEDWLYLQDMSNLRLVSRSIMNYFDNSYYKLAQALVLESINYNHAAAKAALQNMQLFEYMALRGQITDDTIAYINYNLAMHGLAQIRVNPQGERSLVYMAMIYNNTEMLFHIIDTTSINGLTFALIHYGSKYTRTQTIIALLSRYRVSNITGRYLLLTASAIGDLELVEYIHIHSESLGIIHSHFAEAALVASAHDMHIIAELLRPYTMPARCCNIL